MSRRGTPGLRAAAGVALLFAVAFNGGGAAYVDAGQAAARSISVEEYRALRQEVSRLTVQTVGVLNRLALIVARDPDVRRNPRFLDDLGAVTGAIAMLVEVLRAAEPVPDALRASHEALREGFARYGEAARALLPPEEGGPAKFEFALFQEAMLAGGARLHQSDDLLP